MLSVSDFRFHKKRIRFDTEYFFLSIGSIEYDTEYSSYAHAQVVTWVINLFIINQNMLEIIHEHALVKTTTSGVTVQRNTM